MEQFIENHSVVHICAADINLKDSERHAMCVVCENMTHDRLSEMCDLSLLSLGEGKENSSIIMLLNGNNCRIATQTEL